MARYVSIDEIDKIYRKLGCSENEIEIAHMIEDLPTVDAVEVVRCKDCIYRKLNFLATASICEKWLHMIENESHFCSYGAKMDGRNE